MDAWPEGEPLLRERWGELLSSLAAAHNDLDFSTLTISDDAFGQLASYVGLLSLWTGRVDLVAPAAKEVLLDRHVLDSLAAWALLSACRLLPSGAGILDVGSGAGLPGIVFAAVEPKLPVYLCEPREKRVAFLRECRRVLGLPNCVVFPQRFEDLDPNSMSGLSVVISRAVGIDDVILGGSRRLFAASGGSVALMVGSSWKGTVLSAAGMSPFEVLDYAVPHLGGTRSLAVAKCFT